MRLVTIGTIACAAIPVFGTVHPIAAQGAVNANRVQIMALQQELRDRGCSPGHVTGHLNAQTRRAMACARERGFATGTTPLAMLQSLNIGFTGSDAEATLARASGGGMAGVGGVSNMGESGQANQMGARHRTGARARGMRRGGVGMRGRGERMSDSTMRDSMMRNSIRDSMRRDSMRRDSTRSMMPAPTPPSPTPSVPPTPPSGTDTGARQPPR